MKLILIVVVALSFLMPMSSCAEFATKDIGNMVPVAKNPPEGIRQVYLPLYVQINMSDTTVVGIPTTHTLAAYGYIMAEQWFVVAMPKDQQDFWLHHDWGWDWGFWLGPSNRLERVAPTHAAQYRDGGSIFVSTDSVVLWLPHPLRGEDPTFNEGPVQRVFDPQHALTYPRTLIPDK